MHNKPNLSDCESGPFCQQVQRENTRRIGLLEETLPTIGRVAEAMENLTQHLDEIKESQRALATKVEGIREDVVDIKVSVGTYDIRIKALEDARKANESETKDKRKGYRTLILSVVATVLGAALVAWLKLNSPSAPDPKDHHPKPRPSLMLPSPTSAEQLVTKKNQE